VWRVILSVTAAVFDGILVLFMSLALIGIMNQPAIPPVHRTAIRSASVIQSARTAGLVFGGVMTAGFALNLLAIGFGARLPIRRRPSVASIASEFA